MASTSMEPRPHERGNITDPNNYAHGVVLQWSHVLTNVETPRGRGMLEGAPRTSMEPRPHERGNERTGLPGPLRDRGGLQWSHVLTNVETARIVNSSGQV